MSHVRTFTREQRTALARASRDRLAFAGRLRPVVTVGRDEYRREDLVACSYEGSDGYAVLADITFRDRAPRDVEQKRVRIDFETDDESGKPVRLPGFAGFVVKRRDKGYAVTAATGGYEAERTPLGRSPNGDLSWSGERPDRGIYTALMPLRKRYAGYEIGPFDRPLLYRSGADRFMWSAYCKEAADWAAEFASCVIADTPTNVAFAYKLGGVDRDEPPAWHFEEGLDCDEVGDETPDGERYHKVVVLSQPDSKGQVQPLAEAAIDNRNHEVFPGSALMYALDPETDTDSAAVTAYTLARQLGRNDTEVSLEPNYPPFFIRRGDVCSATGKEFRLREANDAAYPGPVGEITSLRYLFRVRSFTVNALEFTGSVAGEGMMVGQEPREMAMPEFPAYATRGFAPLWGLLPDGRSPFLDTRLPWVRQLGPERAEIDTDIAAEHGVRVTVLPDGFLEITDEV